MPHCHHAHSRHMRCDQQGTACRMRQCGSAVSTGSFASRDPSLECTVCQVVLAMLGEGSVISCACGLDAGAWPWLVCIDDVACGVRTHEGCMLVDARSCASLALEASITGTSVSRWAADSALQMKGQSWPGMAW